jgi:uncharacterized membrane protein YjgN (DUF898 family)
MSSVPQHPPPLPPVPVSFSGDRAEFRRLVTRGARLELITFGFYRFWLTTDIRRHLWSNTDVDGDAAEYTGQAKELLIGFLFALAILVPIYLAYFLIGLEAERNKQLSSTPLLVLLYGFGQFAIYRARRYRLTRTVWRGVRFWMDGSAVAYAGRAALWSLLTMLTLGLALPWREAALERYKMEHSYYGDLQGRFDGRGWEFFKRGCWLWLAAVVPVVLYVLIVIISVPRTSRLPLFMLLPILLLAPIVYGRFKAVQWEWWLSGIRFGDVRIESALPRRALIGLYWKVIGWTLPLLALFTGYIYLCVRLLVQLGQVPFAIVSTNGKFHGSIAMLVLAGAGYLVFILAMGVVIRVYLLRAVWTRVVSSTTVHNIEAAADVAAEGELANALGEGLADGLDVAGF